MNLPNTLTVSRIVAAPVVAWLPFIATWQARFGAFALFLAIAITDYYDGKLARETGQITDLGKMLDPLADKLLVFATFIPMFVLVGSGNSLSLWSPHAMPFDVSVQGPFPYVTPFGMIGLPWWILAIVLGREVTMTVFRWWARRRGVVIDASGSAKWKTGLQLAWVGASLFWFGAATAIAEYHLQGGGWTAAAMFIGISNVLSMTGAVGLTVWSLWQYARRHRGLIAGALATQPLVMADFGVQPPGFRLPPETRVGRVRLQVGDLDRSLAYYAGLLGFRVLERAPGRAELGVDRPLIELHELKGARRVPRRGRHGLFHFAILLPDRASLGRIYARLDSAGIQIGSADHAVSEALYLTDPDGLGIEIYADRPRTEWTRRGAELHMVSEPLDIDSLMRAAGKEPWTGMPKGTVIGHAHLHVESLESALAFYHNALGLDLTAWSYPGAIFLSAGGYHHHLGANTWAGAGATAPEKDEAQLLDWELLLPDSTNEVIASLESSGHSPERIGAGEHRVKDPSGTFVRIVGDGKKQT